MFEYFWRLLGYDKPSIIITPHPSPTLTPHSLAPLPHSKIFLDVSIIDTC